MPMMQMPSKIRLLLNRLRPVITTVPRPSLKPVISAAKTAIQAAIKLSLSRVNTPGKTAGMMTNFQRAKFSGHQHVLRDELDFRYGGDRQGKKDAHEDDEYRRQIADPKHH